MNIKRKITIKTDFDVVLARMQARETAKEMGFSMADQARISLAASELARVMIWSVHHNLSELLLMGVATNGHRGMQIACTINLAHVQIPTGNEAHWSQAPSPVSRSLAGACRLADESIFEEQDENSARVTLTKWLK